MCVVWFSVSRIRVDEFLMFSIWVARLRNNAVYSLNSFRQLARKLNEVEGLVYSQLHLYNITLIRLYVKILI